jgi:SsrA-binding protein
VHKQLIDNKKVKFEYFTFDTFEAGLVLEGWEVKSILGGKASINESYVRVIGEEVFLVGCTVTPAVEYSKFSGCDPTRTRKLLLRRQEISKLIGKVKVSGFTIVPLRMIYKNKKIKLEIALAKGKKLVDKRNTVKERDVTRDIQRTMKNKV